MLSFDLDTPTLERLDLVGDNAMAGFVRGAEEQAQLVAERLRESVSGENVNTRSGALLESIQVLSLQVEGANVTVSVVAGGRKAWYGRLLETGGYNSYDIVPKTMRGKGKNRKAIANPKQALAFMVGGEMVFARIVHHPPMPQHQWFSPVVDELTPQIIEGIEQAVKEETEKP